MLGSNERLTSCLRPVQCVERKVRREFTYNTLEVLNEEQIQFLIELQSAIGTDERCL